MVEQITSLDSPIDMMYLMHKAFHAQSVRTEALAAECQDGGDLTEFRESFDLWVKQLLYHVTAEDEYMTGPLTDSQPARDNEAEHVELARARGELIGFLEGGDTAGLTENLIAAMAALDEKQHQELVDKTQEVEQVLRDAMGERKVIGRTRRHLYMRVMSLRVLEFDHFENEEAFVLPLVRDRMSTLQELQLARRLLMDDEADDPRWIIDWVAREIEPEERKLLADLEAQFSTVSA